MKKKGQVEKSAPAKKKRAKGATQPRGPMERVLVMNGTGKTHLEWRPW